MIPDNSPSFETRVTLFGGDYDQLFDLAEREAIHIDYKALKNNINLKNIYFYAPNKCPH